MIKQERMLELSIEAKIGLITETSKDDFLPRTKNKTKHMSESQAEEMIKKWNEKCNNNKDEIGPLYAVKLKVKELDHGVGHPRNNRKRRKRQH